MRHSFFCWYLQMWCWTSSEFVTLTTLSTMVHDQAFRSIALHTRSTAKLSVLLPYIPGPRPSFPFYNLTYHIESASPIYNLADPLCELNALWTSIKYSPIYSIICLYYLSSFWKTLEFSLKSKGSLGLVLEQWQLLC